MIRDTTVAWQLLIMRVVFSLMHKKVYITYEAGVDIINVMYEVLTSKYSCAEVSL